MVMSSATTMLLQTGILNVQAFLKTLSAASAACSNLLEPETRSLAAAVIIADRTAYDVPYSYRTNRCLE